VGCVLQMPVSTPFARHFIVLCILLPFFPEKGGAPSSDLSTRPERPDTNWGRKIGPLIHFCSPLSGYFLFGRGITRSGALRSCEFKMCYPILSH
jgi:hypothetical protein